MHSKNLYIKLFAFVCCVSLFACNAYKEVSLSNDVFLSHKIWKDNYEKYVYLVHDNNSVYTLDDVTLARDSAGQIEAILGTTNALVVDSTVNKSKREIKREKRKEVHLYLTKNQDRVIGDGSGLEIEQEDIQKATVHTRKVKGVLAVLLGIVGVFVGLILLTFLIIIAALIGGGSDGSDSDSDPQCYVATMVYGSTEAPEVLALRRFRDKYLMHSRGGRAFVAWYYKHSPQFVERHRSNTMLNTTIKYLLNGFVSLIKKF